VVAEEAFSLHFGILLDPLSTMMLVIVSLVAFLVHVFSLGYMNDEGETGLPGTTPASACSRSRCSRSSSRTTS